MAGQPLNIPDPLSTSSVTQRSMVPDPLGYPVKSREEPDKNFLGIPAPTTELGQRVRGGIGGTLGSLGGGMLADPLGMYVGGMIGRNLATGQGLLGRRQYSTNYFPPAPGNGASRSPQSVSSNLSPYDIYGGSSGTARASGGNYVSRPSGSGTTYVTNKYGVTTATLPDGKQAATRARF